MKIGIIGCGHMGSGIARRLADAQNDLWVYDHHEKKTKTLADSTRAKACQSAAEVAKEAKVILLAVKPKDLSQAAEMLRQAVTPHHLLISILTGISIDALKERFGNVPILRMMPNLAVLYGQGVVGLTEGPNLSSKTKHNIERVFSPLGLVCWVDEKKIDILTSLTASGLAFFFVMFEAMVDAAIAMGLNASHGKELVLQMLTGALAMLKEAGKHPAELKWEVASPAGTTIAGLKKMEETSVRSGIINTFLAAHNAAKEMAEKV
jgi:pyrroline-5-carboxylate reductase